MGFAPRDHGRILIVAHTANGALYTVNPKTGASAPIAGISVPNVDGLELAGRKLWAVQNASNQITRIRLNKRSDGWDRHESDHQQELRDPNHRGQVRQHLGGRAGEIRHRLSADGRHVRSRLGPRVS